MIMKCCQQAISVTISAKPTQTENLKEVIKIQKHFPRGSTNLEKVNEYAPRRDDL